ncbi:MAG: (deoxy)nucleoside triphosphate pyrophosphohydrolase [Victivallaceae bacterium]|nr:(deoxy)nucleoside triphosphate pyrophosphohydrolase [Victivallaceae bacterium]
MKNTIEVGAAVIFDGDEILITSRPLGREYAGLWEFPGGKIEYGETPAQCLVRELDEELGISVNTFDQIYFTKYEYPERIVCLHFIRCMMASNSSAPMPRENQQLQWLRRGISHRINFLPADEDVALFLGL